MTDRLWSLVHLLQFSITLKTFKPMTINKGMKQRFNGLHSVKRCLTLKGYRHYPYYYRRDGLSPSIYLFNPYYYIWFYELFYFEIYLFYIS